MIIPNRRQRKFSNIQDITVDIRDLEQFYNISSSSTRIERLGEYVVQRINQAVTKFRGSFDCLDQEGKVDLLIIRAHLKRRYGLLKTALARNRRLKPLLGSWASNLVELCERLQKVVPTDGKYVAKVFSNSVKAMFSLIETIRKDELKTEVSKFTAYRAAEGIEELHLRLTEFWGFYTGYDPMFDYWAKVEFQKLHSKLPELKEAIREQLVGIQTGDEDAIVGQPSGRESIVADLETEMIPYSPEELLKMADIEYDWCEKEIIKASRELGYGSDWKKALEHVKEMYEEPGQQIYTVHDLAKEAVDYVTQQDMVTIPEIANETWRTL